MRTQTDRMTGGERLHIAFCVNEPYVPYMLVAVRGIIDNNDGLPITLHILTDNISDGAERRIRDEIADARDIEYMIHRVDDSALAGQTVRHYTIYTWYRMLLPEMLPDVGKLLYLDTDIAVNGSLRQLRDFDMGDNAIATPMDTDTFTDEPFERCGYARELQYVCVGVMLMNLDRWRRDNIAARVLEYGRENAARVKYPDQDSINYVCRDSKTYIPLRYGVTKSLLEKPWFYTPQYADELRDAIERPAIIHYAGCAPWLRESDHPMVDIWMRYNKRLHHPARRRYATKGVLGLKLRLWDLLHPGASRAPISVDEARRRLDTINPQ